MEFIDLVVNLLRLLYKLSVLLSFYCNYSNKYLTLIEYVQQMILNSIGSKHSDEIVD